MVLFSRPLSPLVGSHGTSFAVFAAVHVSQVASINTFGQSEGHSLKSCFGMRRNGHIFTAEACCDVLKHGRTGDERCWGYDDESGIATSFDACCVDELLGLGLFADRPPLIVDLLLDLHPSSARLWEDARGLCGAGQRCRHAEVYFTGLQLLPSGKIGDRSSEERAPPSRSPTRAVIDVGAHVKSQYLEELELDPSLLLVALEPDRMSCRYHLDYAQRVLSADALRRLWLIPAAVGERLGLAVLHRANRFYDGQCSSLLEFRSDAVAWAGCTEQTGEDVVSTIPLSEIISRLPSSVADVALKVDVQGFDLQVILSAGDELRRVSHLTVEVQDMPPEDPRVRYVGQRSRQEIEETLTARGFELESCAPYSEEGFFIRETDCIFVRPATTASDAAIVRAHLVTFAQDEPFEGVQRKLAATAQLANFSSHRGGNLEALFQRLADSTSNPLADIETGSFLPFRARWWKPFVILDRLLDPDVQDGEWVVYQDSSRYVPKGFKASAAGPLQDFLRGAAAGGADAIVGAMLPQSVGWEWAQRCVPNYSLSPEDWDASTEESLSSALCRALESAKLCVLPAVRCCEDARRRPMLQNSWLAFRKCGSSAAFLREWLQLNVDDEVMHSMPFADQSLFELLAYARAEDISLRILDSTTVRRPCLTRECIGLWNQPANQIKHLGVALELLSSGDGSQSLATIVPLRADLEAEWLQGTMPHEAWRESLCRV